MWKVRSVQPAGLRLLGAVHDDDGRRINLNAEERWKSLDARGLSAVDC